MDSLLPCPFCAEKAMRHWNATLGGPMALVRCLSCHASTDDFRTAEEADTAWNTRKETEHG